jgi:hypothetical protein
MEGAQNFHQVKSVGLDKKHLHVQNLSCFWKLCSDNGDGPCANETYVAPFNFVWLKPYNANDACEDVNFVLHLESDWEVLTTILEVGDHFVVIAKEEYGSI